MVGRRQRTKNPTRFSRGSVKSFKGLDRVSLLTLDGRKLIPVRLGDYQRARMDRRRGQADLLYRNGAFYLALTVDAPEPEPDDPTGVLGVDLGITNLAVDSDGETHSGEAVERSRKRYERIRRKLQPVKTASARKRKKKLGNREARFKRDTNHRISKALVRKAKDTNRAIALEDLRHLRGRTTVRKSQRSRHSKWAYAQLRDFLEYKARLAGVPVYMVDPRNTSRTCSECGHCEKANRRSQAEFICRSCGFVAAADHNAAINIAARVAVMLPKVSDGQDATRASLASPETSPRALAVGS